MDDITCPYCNSTFDFIVGCKDKEGAALFKAALALLGPELSTPLIRYLTLFRTDKTKKLSWEKSARLLNELAEPIGQNRLTHDRRTYATSRELWIDALSRVIDRGPHLDLPLKDHGYLFKIAVSLAKDKPATVPTASIERPQPTGKESKTLGALLALENLKSQ